MKTPLSAYREQALKLYPWVCGRCARDFSGARHESFADLADLLEGRK